MNISCNGNVITQVTQCCNQVKGVRYNNTCLTGSESSAFVNCVGSEASANNLTAQCAQLSSNSGGRAINKKVTLMVTILMMVGMVSAAGGQRKGVYTVSGDELTGGYKADIGSASIPRTQGEADPKVPISKYDELTQKRQNNKDNGMLYFEDEYPVNTRYYLGLDGDKGLLGSYTPLSDITSIGNYTDDLLMYEEPEGFMESGLHNNTDKRDATWIIRSNTYAKMSTKKIDTGGIAMSDFARSLCYDRCGWNDWCDSDNELVWTTNYITGNSLRRNVRLSGRLYGRIQFLWSDQIKWQVRDAMCEALKTTILSSNTMTVQNKQGCESACSGVQCERFGCAQARQDMYTSPQAGNVELWTKWNDNGESMAMWVHWEIQQLGTWNTNICAVIGIFLGFAGWLPWFGPWATAGGIATSTYCGT